jgi:hypothetical protein
MESKDNVSQIPVTNQENKIIHWLVDWFIISQKTENDRLITDYSATLKAHKSWAPARPGD